MPSTMIHLLVAQKVKPHGHTEFFIGNIAPDSVVMREDYHFAFKDKLHFRGSQNRLKDIENLAREIDISSPYNEGYIMHLFMDMHWDMDCMKPYIAGREGIGWVKPYHEEITKASSWLINNHRDLQRIWQDMVNYDKRLETVIQGVEYWEAKKYCINTEKWYAGYKATASNVFTPEFIDEYTSGVASKYVEWRDKFSE